MKHAFAAALALALALLAPAVRAAPTAPLVVAPSAALAPASASVGFHTGLHAPDVGPLVVGVVADGAQMLVFAGCFLALDDNDTCIDLAGKARDRTALLALSSPAPR